MENSIQDDMTQLLSIISGNIKNGIYNGQTVSILKNAIRQMEQCISYRELQRPEYLYMLIKPEFIKSEETIVKIGRTERPFVESFKEYPNGSVILGVGHVKNCILGEKLLISEFKKYYQRRLDIGLEYFSGNLKMMKKTFYDTLYRIAESELKVIPINSISTNIAHNNSITDTDNIDANFTDEDIIDVTTAVNIPIITNTTRTMEVKGYDSFCKHVYETRPDWYRENQLVAVEIIYNEYQKYSGDYEVRDAVVSRNLGGKMFEKGEGGRDNGKRAKRLYTYERMGEELGL